MNMNTRKLHNGITLKNSQLLIFIIIIIAAIGVVIMTREIFLFGLKIGIH